MKAQDRRLRFRGRPVSVEGLACRQLFIHDNSGKLTGTTTKDLKRRSQLLLDAVFNPESEGIVIDDDTRDALVELIGDRVHSIEAGL
jgi:hypothetical protein